MIFRHALLLRTLHLWHVEKNYGPPIIKIHLCIMRRGVKLHCPITLCQPNGGKNISLPWKSVFVISGLNPERLASGEIYETISATKQASENTHVNTEARSHGKQEQNWKGNAKFCLRLIMACNNIERVWYPTFWQYNDPNTRSSGRQEMFNNKKPYLVDRL